MKFIITDVSPEESRKADLIPGYAPKEATVYRFTAPHWKAAKAQLAKVRSQYHSPELIEV